MNYIIGADNYFVKQNFIYNLISKILFKSLAN